MGMDTLAHSNRFKKAGIFADENAQHHADCHSKAQIPLKKADSRVVFLFHVPNPPESLFLEPIFQIQYLFLNEPNGFQKSLVRLSGGVIQPPILPPLAGQEGALDIAAHCDNHIHLRNVRQELAVLPLALHVEVVHLLHQAHGIGIDLRFRFRPGGQQ